jgi:predicted phosphodiesterase
MIVQGRASSTRTEHGARSEEAELGGFNRPAHSQDGAREQGGGHHNIFFGVRGQAMTKTSNRRPFLAASATALVLFAVVLTADPRSKDEPAPKGEPVAFFLVGDTHILANKKAPGEIDDRSAAVSAGLIDVLNKLPGTIIPEKAGGGKVLAARGVIHAGDCIDTGDKANVQMQETEWAAFASGFGLTGTDGKLKLPIYEVHGNHDSPRSDGLALKKIIERNRTRPGATNVSTNGLHYSWDWGNVHFVNLGIVVGQVEGVTRKRRYDPHASLDFLISDLKQKVGTSGRPVVLTHHVDMLRYSQALPVADKKAAGMEWDPVDVKGFYDALQDYNVAAILYGHTHVRNVFHWDGTAKRAETGIPVFNVSKSSHFASKQQAFFYIEIRGDTVTAREYQTGDAWQTGTWTPLTWTAAVRFAH